MYKSLIFIFTLIVSFTGSSNAFHAQPLKEPPVQADFCPTCVNVANQSINILLSLIVDSRVLNSCGALCNALGNETHSEIVGSICKLACDAIGLTEFVRLLRAADLDAIWYCELAELCPINDHGDAKITSFSLSPATGTKGTNFTVSFSLVSRNGTGTGELVFDVHCPDRVGYGFTALLEAKNSGTYAEKLVFTAASDPKCDPTSKPCEQWIPGLYNITVQVCNGECGSKHPHSGIYDTAKVSFQITSS